MAGCNEFLSENISLCILCILEHLVHISKYWHICPKSGTIRIFGLWPISAIIELFVPYHPILECATYIYWTCIVMIGLYLHRHIGILACGGALSFLWSYAY